MICDKFLSIKMVELLINDINLYIEKYELEKNKQINKIKQLESGLKKNFTELDRFYTLTKYFEEKEAAGIIANFPSYFIKTWYHIIYKNIWSYRLLCL
jgi:hypothetical protein